MQKIAFLVSKLWTCPLPPQPCASWTPLWYNYMHTHGIAPLCFKYHSNKTPCTIFTKTYIQYLPSIIFQSLFICDCKTNNSFNGNWKFSQSILAQFFFWCFHSLFFKLKTYEGVEKIYFSLVDMKVHALSFRSTYFASFSDNFKWFKSSIPAKKPLHPRNSPTHGIAPPYPTQ